MPLPLKKKFEIKKKGWKQLKKCISTSFQVRAGPESWSKDTTFPSSKNIPKFLVNCFCTFFKVEIVWNNCLAIGKVIVGTKKYVFEEWSKKVRFERIIRQNFVFLCNCQALERLKWKLLYRFKEK